MSRAASILQKSKNESGNGDYSAKDIEDAVKYGKSLFDVKMLNKVLDDVGFEVEITKVKKEDDFITLDDDVLEFSFSVEYMRDGKSKKGTLLMPYSPGYGRFTEIDLN